MFAEEERAQCPAWSFRPRGVQAYALLNLAFLIDHVFTDNGIVLFDLHFVRRVLFVFVCGVVMACARTRYQLDFIAHVLNFRFVNTQPEGCVLNLLATSTHLFKYLVDTLFVDDAHTVR